MVSIEKSKYAGLIYTGKMNENNVKFNLKIGFKLAT